jgi:hypothetical protein
MTSEALVLTDEKGRTLDCELLQQARCTVW